ncbi:MAG: ankyrin repeat domain-containing protein [Bacteroidota bacterium]
MAVGWSLLPEPFRTALRHGDAATLQALLNAGLDVNARLARGLTPLMVAVDCGDLNAVRWLLASGADATAVDDLGYSVAMHARYEIERRARSRPVVFEIADLIDAVAAKASGARGRTDAEPLA